MEFAYTISATPGAHRKHTRFLSAYEEFTTRVHHLAARLARSRWQISRHAVTPGGRRALAASEDRTLKLWNLQSGQEERTFSGHSDKDYL